MVEDWCDRTLPRKASEDATPVTADATPQAVKSSFATRHRQALRDILKYDSSAREIQKNWAASRTRLAKKRLTYSTARRLHMGRASFQQRKELQKKLEDERIDQPTIWQLKESPKILREAMQDMCKAVRSVRIGKLFGEDLQATALDRKTNPKGWKLVKSHATNLMAVAAVEAMLEETHDAEVQWMALLKSVQSPR